LTSLVIISDTAHWQLEATVAAARAASGHQETRDLNIYFFDISRFGFARAIGVLSGFSYNFYAQGCIR
jgi:hypothetical protein